MIKTLLFWVRKFKAVFQVAEAKLVAIQKKNQIKEWNILFKSTDSVIFPLSPTIKIKLFKQSAISELIYRGFEESEIQFLKETLTEGDYFLDIGANIGLFSLFAAEKVGTSGKVIAFEPAPDTFQKLTENIQINNFTNVELHNLGVSDQVSKIPFFVSQNGYDAWNSFGKLTNKSQTISTEVEVKPLDSLLQETDISKIKLVKIDVEGWEKFVLQGGEHFFKTQQPIVMMEFTESTCFEVGYMVQELYDIMETYGYRWYELKNQQLIPHKKQLHYPYNNLIAKK
ncbi:FkbM family methyltransferase [Flavobacterium sp.]|uniref:FkbM family methyltransferase n=1 Tax=Flavobacterium sp. TaxID=239 RepID=UPI003B9A28A6